MLESMRQCSLRVHQVIVQLQSQADSCEYGTICNELVRDRIVVGVNNIKLWEYLFDVQELTLTKCILKPNNTIVITNMLLGCREQATRT